MTMPCEIRGREYTKFEEIDGETHVRTTAKGEFTFSGLSKELKVTTLMVTTTATAIPLTPLDDRNSMEVHNLSATETLYVGNADVTADAVIGTTSGKEIPPLSYWSIDIKNAIILYGRAATTPIMIKVMEVA